MSQYTLNTQSPMHNRRYMQRMTPYLLAFPAAFLVIAFLVVPVGYAFYVSLYRCDYLNFTRFLGLGNYLAVLGDASILKTIALTAWVSFVGLLFALVFGVSIALWIHNAKKKLAYFLQIISLIPWVTSMIVSALLWRWMLQDDLGLVNFLLSNTSIGAINFLSNRTIAICSLIFVMTWRVIAYVMVQVLAGLKSIPIDFEEAATIDGASRWQLFWRIKVPLLKTPLAISSIIIALSNINNVTVPLTLTGGGPGTATTVMAMEVYKQSFTYYHFGESSALSILMCAVNFLLIILYVKAVKYDEC